MVCRISGRNMELTEEKRAQDRLRRRRKVALMKAGIAGGCLLVLLFLITCGVLYLKEHLFPEKTVKTEGGKEQGFLGITVSDKETGKNQWIYTVVLDAGHGGSDGGSVKAGVTEKDITLEMALRLRDTLEKKKIRVIMTREEDIFLELEERTGISNEEQPDLFISLHCNSFDKDSSVSGLECYYYPDSEKGMWYAQELCSNLQNSGKISVRGPKAEDYYVLRNTKCTAILIEAGYLTNRKDREHLTDAVWQKMFAVELADCIKSMLEDQEEMSNKK